MNSLSVGYKWLTPDQISSYGLMWFGQTLLNQRQELYEQARAANKCKILRYITLVDTIDPQAFDRGLYDRKAEEDWWDFTCIKPEWFLLKDVSKPSQPDNWFRYANTTDPNSYSYYRYIIDVTNPDFQRWALTEIVRKVEVDRLHPQYNYSGVALDNCFVGRFVKESFSSQNWKYKDKEDEWSEQVLSFIAMIHAILSGREKYLAINVTLQPSTADDDVWAGKLDTDAVLFENVIKAITQDKIKQLARYNTILQGQGVKTWLFSFGDTYADYLAHEGTTQRLKPDFDSFRSSEATDKTILLF